MNRDPRSLGSITVALGCALLAAACVSLLPKVKPAQLYRFTVAAPAAPVATPTAGAIGIRLSEISLPPAAAGASILTIRGDQAAYIKDARWVSSASALFEAAAADAFAARSARVRLLAEGESAPAAYSLRLDVRRFEVSYGPGPAPSVAIEVYAALARAGGPPDESAQIFRVTAPASDDRVGAIVEAYDQATASVLGQIIDWVNAKANA